MYHINNTKQKIDRSKTRKIKQKAKRLPALLIPHPNHRGAIIKTGPRPRHHALKKAVRPQRRVCMLKKTERHHHARKVDDSSYSRHTHWFRGFAKARKGFRKDKAGVSQRQGRGFVRTRQAGRTGKAGDRHRHGKGFAKENQGFHKRKVMVS